MRTDTPYITKVYMYVCSTYFWCGTHMLVWVIIFFAFSVLFPVLGTWYFPGTPTKRPTVVQHVGERRGGTRERGERGDEEGERDEESE